MVPVTLAIMKAHLSPVAALGDMKNVPLCLGVIKLWVEILPCSFSGKSNNDELSGIFMVLMGTGFKIMCTVHLITFFVTPTHFENVIPASA
jgi:hypothetical protein